jgi:putative transposase
LSIDPGCPWQNEYGESFNGKVRDECLNLHVFQSVAEARVVLAAYRPQYNRVYLDL